MNHFSSPKVNSFFQQLSIFQHLIGSSNSLRRNFNNTPQGRSHIQRELFEHCILRHPRGKRQAGNILYREWGTARVIMNSIDASVWKVDAQILTLRCIHTTNQHVRDIVTVIIIYSVICCLGLTGRSADVWRSSSDLLIHAVVTSPLCARPVATCFTDVQSTHGGGCSNSCLVVLFELFTILRNSVSGFETATQLLCIPLIICIRL